MIWIALLRLRGWLDHVWASVWHAPNQREDAFHQSKNLSRFLMHLSLCVNHWTHLKAIVPPMAAANIPTIIVVSIITSGIRCL